MDTIKQPYSEFKIGDRIKIKDTCADLPKYAALKDKQFLIVKILDPEPHAITELAAVRYEAHIQFEPFTLDNHLFNEHEIELTQVDIAAFCRNLVHGTGGFIAYETYELYSPADRDVALIEWAVRCLANVECEGAADVLQAIADRRNNKAES